MKKSKTTSSSSVTIHDNSQVQFRFRFPIQEKATGRNLGSRKYFLRLFVYMPYQFVSRDSQYPKEQFYTDLQNYVRLGQPTLKIGKLKVDSEGSPLTYLKGQFSNKHSFDRRRFNTTVKEAKLFGCSYFSWSSRKLRRKIIKLESCLRKKKKWSQIPDVVQNIRDHLGQARILLLQWRELMDSAKANHGDRHPGLISELKKIDEYCSTGYVSGLLYLLERLQNHLILCHKQILTELQQDIMPLIEEQRVWFEKNSYLWLTADSKKEMREKVLNQRRYLKRHIWSLMFLNVRAKPLFTFQRQVGSMLAAGLAAAWAAAANIAIFSYTAIAIDDGFNNLLGINGFLFLNAIVLAYILKDRIKEIGRGYFGNRFISKIYDNYNQIVFEFHERVKWNLGYAKERIRSLKADEVPREVCQIRQDLAAEGLVNSDDFSTLYTYEKIMQINALGMDFQTMPVASIEDILRWNLERFRGKMDDPGEPDYAIDEFGEVQQVKLPKVYTVDTAVYVEKQSNSGSQLECCEYYRFYLNKKGLIRLEKLSEIDVSGSV